MSAFCDVLLYQIVKEKRMNVWKIREAIKEDIFISTSSLNTNMNGKTYIALTRIPHAHVHTHLTA